MMLGWSNLVIAFLAVAALSVTVGMVYLTLRIGRRDD
jgi:hypothetical protein